MGFGILSDNVLIEWQSVTVLINEKKAGTYCLLPGPVCRHEVSETMDFSISTVTVLLKGRIIEIRFKIWIWQHILDNSFGVTKPDIVFCLHPWRNIVCRLRSVMLYAKWLPGDIAKRGRINYIVKIFSVGKWGLILVDSKRCRPETKNEVDVPGGHLVTTKEKVGKFELESIIVRLPVVRCRIWITGRCVRRYILSVLITYLSWKQY